MLIDLLDMDIKSTSESRPRSLTTSSSPPADLMWGPTASDPRPPNPSASSAALCLLDEELLSLGLSETVPGTGKPTRVNLSECLPSSQASSQDLALFDITSSSVPVCCSPPLLSDVLSASTVSLNRSSSTGAMFSTALVCKKSDWAGLALSSVLTTTVPAASPAPPTPVHTSPQPSYTTLSSQNLQDFTLLELSSPTITPQQKTEQDLFTPAPLSFSHCASSNKPTSLLLRGMPGVSTSPPVNSQTDNSLPLHPPSSLLHLSCSTPGWEQQASLANVFVPLDAVRPSHECLVTAYDKNGIRVVLHFATDCPGGRADILVMVASIRSTAPLPVRNVVLQAAVPKTMKVRLQQPSGTELAPFNPVLPPASITQVILLANPLKEKVRMRYKLTFTLGEQWYTEVGEVNEFPPVHTRGAL